MNSIYCMYQKERLILVHWGDIIYYLRRTNKKIRKYLDDNKGVLIKVPMTPTEIKDTIDTIMRG